MSTTVRGTPACRSWMPISQKSRLYCERPRGHQGEHAADVQARYIVSWRTKEWSDYVEQRNRCVK